MSKVLENLDFVSFSSLVLFFLYENPELLKNENEQIKLLLTVKSVPFGGFIGHL